VDRYSWQYLIGTSQPLTYPTWRCYFRQQTEGTYKYFSCLSRLATCPDVSICSKWCPENVFLFTVKEKSFNITWGKFVKSARGQDSGGSFLSCCLPFSKYIIDMEFRSKVLRQTKRPPLRASSRGGAGGMRRQGGIVLLSRVVYNWPYVCQQPWAACRVPSEKTLCPVCVVKHRLCVSVSFSVLQLI
jgi:hypothetical protein